MMTSVVTKILSMLPNRVSLTLCFIPDITCFFFTTTVLNVNAVSSRSQGLTRVFLPLVKCKTLKAEPTLNGPALSE